MRAQFTLVLPVLILCDVLSDAVSIPGWLYLLLFFVGIVKFDYSYTR